MAERIGQRLGNYNLIRRLGQGGFAEVYLGEHVHLHTLAAVKILLTHLSHKDKESFHIEAQTIARLVHPHIVRVLDYGTEETTPFLVMDYAPGGTLREKHPKGTQLPPATIAFYVRQIADALQYAHNEKLIHRDVKPENMLLGRRNEVLLSDFGIAIVAQSSLSQSPQQMAGTIIYMAPEQLRGKPRIASDQYALGIVVYEWLCGSPPFVGSFPEIASQHVLVPPPPLHERIPTISSELEHVVLTALAKEPQQRFSSTQAFATALEQACRASKQVGMSTSLRSSSVIAPSASLSLIPSDLRSPADKTFPPSSIPGSLGLTTAQPTPSFESPLPSPEIMPSSSQLSQNPPTPIRSYTIPQSSHGKERNHKSPASLFPKRFKTPFQKLHGRSKWQVALFVGMLLLVVTTSAGFLSPTLVKLFSINSMSGHTTVPSEPPILTLSTNVVTIGQTVTLHIQHFTANTHVSLTHDIEEMVQLTDGSALVVVGATGSANVQMLVDDSWEPGYHTLEAEDMATRYTASATLQITGAGPTRPSHLLIAATTLDLRADYQGANTIQTLMLHNMGSSSITWAGSSNQPWLLLSPTQGIFSASQQIRVAAERANLKPGDYKGIVTFSSNVGPAERVQVRMSVRPLPTNAGTVMVVTPPVLSLTGVDGGTNPAEQALMISNPGQHPLSWMLTGDNAMIDRQSWLTTDHKTDVVSPHGTSVIHVLVNSHDLLPGVYSDVLMFTGSHGAYNSPQSISISLIIQPRCRLTLNRGIMSFTKVSGQNNSSNQSLGFSATANCAGVISWKAVSAASWLTVTPASGQLKAATSAVTAVGVNTMILKPGTYIGDITFLAAQSTQTLTVQLIVQPPPPPNAPIMSATPLNLNFSTMQGMANPPGQVVTITNTGKSLLNWHTTVNTLASSWLGASPTGGSIPAGQTGQVTININTAGLTPNTYTGQVILNGTDAKGVTAPGSPQTITVQLMVLPPCTLEQPSASALAFNAVQGTADPISQLETLTAFGHCTWPLSWHATAANAPSWLKLSATSGSFAANGQSTPIIVNASIAGLVAGTYMDQVVITATDAANAPVLGSPQILNVTLTVLMVTGYTISGTVLVCVDTACSTSSPLPGASLRLMDTTNQVLTSTADSSGNFSFTGLAPGSYTLTATRSDASNNYSGSVTLTLTGDQLNLSINAIPTPK